MTLLFFLPNVYWLLFERLLRLEEPCQELVGCPPDALDSETRQGQGIRAGGVWQIGMVMLYNFFASMCNKEACLVRYLLYNSLDDVFHLFDIFL